MKLGAEPKKVAILILLLLVAAYFLYTNLASSPAGSPEPSAHSAASDVTPSPETVVPARSIVARGGTPRRSEQEFHPSFHVKGVDPGTIDPKLRLDLLDKVRSVDLEPATRNLFAYGAMPPPALTQQAKNLGPIHPTAAAGAPGSPGAADPNQPPPPPPLPSSTMVIRHNARMAASVLSFRRVIAVRVPLPPRRSATFSLQPRAT